MEKKAINATFLASTVSNPAEKVAFDLKKVNKCHLFVFIMVGVQQGLI
jgi:hypothetical protein